MKLSRLLSASWLLLITQASLFAQAPAAAPGAAPTNAPPAVSPAPAPNSTQIVLKEVSGTVDVRGSALSPWITAAKNGILSPDYGLRTGPGSSAIVQLGSAGAMTLGESTIVEIKQLVEEANGSLKAKLKALAGKVWFAVQKMKSSDSSFEVESPTGLAGVRGTIFLTSVTAEGGTTRFGVQEGLVEVRSTTVEGSVTLKPGEATVVIANKPPTPPEVFEERERGEWLKLESGLMNAVPMLNIVPAAGQMMEQHREEMAAATKSLAESKSARKGGDKAQQDLSDMMAALTKFYVDTGKLPPEKGALDALVKDPGIPGWKGPYLGAASNLMDPFGKPYQYKLTKSPGGKDIIMLRCWGPDGGPNTPDDIVQLVPVSKLEKARASAMGQNPPK